MFQKHKAQDYHPKYKEKFWGIPQNLVGIYFTSEIFGNLKNVACVILWLFIGIELLGTFLVMWKLQIGINLGNVEFSQLKKKSPSN